MYTFLLSILTMVSLTRSIPIDQHDPSPYTVYSEICQTIGPVQVCAQNIQKGFPFLLIQYATDGYLWDKASPISAWVKLNDHELITPNFYAASDGRGGAVKYAYYTLGRFQNLQLCYRATTKDDVDYTYKWYRRCPVTDRFPLLNGGMKEGKLDWYYDGRLEENFFENVSRTNWKVEIAFKNDIGYWDSLNGKNYQFHFNIV
ncbi:hypothetical protein BC833DRAFT_588421 [Globomyces pollinis-pini]|nr:hypothetical protein BC833DRAFT_588421 [Globomyces pollinis-pini]